MVQITSLCHWRKGYGCLKGNTLVECKPESGGCSANRNELVGLFVEVIGEPSAKEEVVGWVREELNGSGVLVERRCVGQFFLRSREKGALRPVEEEELLVEEDEHVVVNASSVDLLERRGDALAILDLCNFEPALFLRFICHFLRFFEL